MRAARNDTLLSLRSCGFLRPAPRRPSLCRSLLGSRLHAKCQHDIADLFGRLQSRGGLRPQPRGLRRCQLCRPRASVGVAGGVVGSGTCCAILQLGTLHLSVQRLTYCLFETGSVRGEKKKLDIGLISVDFGFRAEYHIGGGPSR